MIYTLYPLFKYDFYDNLLSKKIIKEYKKDKINEKYYNDIKYIQQNFDIKIKNENFDKNDYLSIEYLSKKYPKNAYFQLLNNSFIPHYNFIEIKENNSIFDNKKILPINNEIKIKNNIQIIRKKSIKESLYEDLYDYEEENENNDMKKDKISNIKFISGIALSTTILISLLIIKCNLIN